MDINKEREAFEQALVNQKNVSINNLHVCTIFDAEKNKYSPSDVCDPKEDFIVDWINSSWSIWQSAKAQAVPEWIRMEDKYPKAGESVLICINGIRQNIAYFYDCSVSNEYSDHDWFEPVFTGGEAGDECVVKTEDVTHWMLLPQEPAND
ncbi:DUF551 domain-containing protein [Acinetobacter sp. TW_SC_4]